MLETPVDHVGDTAVVTVSGEVDMETSSQLRQVVMGLLGAGHTNIVLDLGRLRFIDSTGLGVLIGAHRRATEMGGALTLRKVTSRTRDTLRMVALDDVLCLEPDPPTDAGAGH